MKREFGWGVRKECCILKEIVNKPRMQMTFAWLTEFNVMRSRFILLFCHPGELILITLVAPEESPRGIEFTPVDTLTVVNGP